MLLGKKESQNEQQNQDLAKKADPRCAAICVMFVGGSQVFQSRFVSNIIYWYCSGPVGHAGC